MMDHTHLPTPEFRDYLAAEITREIRRGSRRTVLRAAAIVLATVALGSSAGLAAAQMRDGSRRDSLLAAAEADLGVAGLRVQLARSVLADVANKVKVGFLLPTSLANAEAELRAAEAQAMRRRLDVDEIRLSAQPPRDELNAPLVGGRDFVRERLQLDLLAAQQRLASAERAAEEAARRVRVGAEGSQSQLDAGLEVARARAQFGALAERQALRKEFVEKRTPVEQLVRRMRQAELRLDAMVAQQAVAAAAERLAVAQRQRAAGAIDEIEVLRAQVELRERELELQRLARQLQQLR